jgi:hypothetical protein
MKSERRSTPARKKTLPEKIWRRFPPTWRYAITIASATIISVVDALWAARHNPTEGERGGAFATFLALFIVLLLPEKELKALASCSLPGAAWTANMLRKSSPQMP